MNDVEIVRTAARAFKALQDITMADSKGNTNPASDQQSSARSKHLELPTPTASSRTPKPKNIHLLPSTALFHGPHSRNESRSSVNRVNEDRTPATPSQHLPRAHPPTASFSGASRPSQLKDIPVPNVRPLVGQRGLPSQNFTATSKKQDEFRADAVWAEMQKTLADVELSAINSSHVFGATHAKALEDLRAAQLGLAQAWAKSEADEMVDEEFARDENESGAVGQSKGAFFGAPAKPGPPGSRGNHSPKGHSRNASVASNASGAGERMEEETERDIRLARRRREANDRYFKQVNRGVLDVVRKLDDVTTAMRRVEKESREIWNESSGSEDLGDVTETDQSTQAKKVEKTPAGRARATTNETTESAITLDTETDLLSSSPESKR